VQFFQNIFSQCKIIRLKYSDQTYFYFSPCQSRFFSNDKIFFHDSTENSIWSYRTMVITSEKRQRGRPRNIRSADDGASVQSLDRAIQLLRLVADADGLSLTELSRASGLAPSTAYRMLTTLQHHNLAEFEETDQLWFTGVELFRMGASFLRRRKLAERGRVIIEGLRMATGETANLAVAESDAVVFVTQSESHEPIRAFFRPGTRGPYHASGIGKAILAFRDEAARRKALPARLDRFTAKTLTEWSALEADFILTRQRGFALDDEERTLGMRCIAAPVFNEFGEPFGGVSVSGPSVRVDDAFIARVGPLVIEAALALTQAVGGQMRT
jgi:IclR family transcriptional regulator, acetate operon repressor